VFLTFLVDQSADCSTGRIINTRHSTGSDGDEPLLGPNRNAYSQRQRRYRQPLYYFLHNFTQKRITKQKTAYLWTKTILCSLLLSSQLEPQCPFTTNSHPIPQQCPLRFRIINTEELKCTILP